MKSVISRKKHFSREKVELGKVTNPILEVLLDASLLLLRLNGLFLEQILKYMQKLDVKIEKVLEGGE